MFQASVADSSLPPPQSCVIFTGSLLFTALKGSPHLFSGCQGFIWLSLSEPHTPTERHPRVLAKDLVPNPLILTYVI